MLRNRTGLHRNISINNFDTVSYAYALLRPEFFWDVTERVGFIQTFRDSLQVPHSGTGGPETSVILYQLGMCNDQDGGRSQLHRAGNFRSGRILFEEK